MDQRFAADYYKRINEGGFDEKDFNDINKKEEATSLLILVNRWLERMPFFNIDLWQNYAQQFAVTNDIHPFWNDYRKIYADSLNEKEAGRINDFDFIFFEKKDNTLVDQSPENAFVYCSCAARCVVHNAVQGLSCFSNLLPNFGFVN